MVLIKNLTQTQINGISDNYKGEVITNADNNKLMYNNGTQFTYLVYSDLNNIISGLSGISATNLTGTLQTADQPNVTSLGTLNGLTVNNNLVVAQHNGVDTGLTLGGDLVTSSAEQLNYVNTTPGTAEAGKALVTDSNNAIVGLTNVETDNLTVNGTLVTSSAIELNYVDVNTLGVAQASKALVVDADKNITGINTLEADYIQVNGTLVTSSAIELNYVDVDALGVAQASKALVVDANRNIGNINDLTATNLTGTLQTASQPNITSVGTLTGLTVAGTASVDNLVVNGVPLNAFNTGGLKLRAYSTPDFSGRVIKADVVTTVNFTDYTPATGITTNWSMELWGYIKPLYTESYTFTVNANDRFRLWINNELTRVEWTDGDDTNLQTSPIALTANTWYPIYIQHAQYSDGEHLVITWSSASQVTENLPGSALAYDDKQVPVSARKTFTQDSMVIYDSTNSNLSTISSNTSGDLTVSAASSNVNIAGHNGSTAGLKLNGTLVTSTATELNYNDTTVGLAAATKSVVLDSNKDFVGIRNVTTEGYLGINTSAPDKQLEINSATGDVLRLTYNDSDGSATNYADLDISSDGKLTINSSGDETIIHSSDSFNIAGHDGSTTGLKLASVLVTATADEINYLDTTPGTVEASKALVFDADRNITNINSLTSSLLVSTSTDNSTSTTTGAVVIAGGVGIAKSVNIGEHMDVTGAATVGSTLDVTGAATLSNTLAVTGASTLTGSVSVLNTTDSASVSTGSIVTAGGAGIAKSVNIGETLTVIGDSTFNADLTVDGPSLRIPVGDTASRPTGTLGQVRYNTETSQFEGYGAGNAWGSLGGLIDVDQDTKITAEDSAGADNDELKFYNAGSESMRLTNTGLLGLGTTVPAKKLEINSETGDVLRMTYNDSDGSATNYVDMTISSDGKLTINSSGNETIIHSSDSFNIAGHDGATLGLKLGGTLVTATADELNYTDTTPGTAQASKALIVNSLRNISNINNISATGNAVVTGSTTSGSLYLSSNETASFDPASFNTVSVTSTMAWVQDYSNVVDRGITAGQQVVSSSGYVTLNNSSVLDSYLTANGFSSYTATLSVGGACIADDGTVFMGLRLNKSGGTYAPGIAKASLTSYQSMLWHGADYNQFPGVMAAASATSLVFVTSGNNQVWYTTDGTTFAQSTTPPTGMYGDPLSGSGLLYARGLGMYIAATYSGIFTSSDGNVWTAATTPGGYGIYLYYNNFLNKVFAYNRGGTTLLQSTNGTTWTSVTLPSLGTMTLGNMLVNKHNGVTAIYPSAPATNKTLLYSIDGSTWSTLTLTIPNTNVLGTTFIATSRIGAVFADNIARYTISDSGFKTVTTGAINSIAAVFKLNYLTGGYLANQSKTGYQWYSASTDVSTGNKIMELDNELSMTVSQSVENTTDSSSSSTGALKVAGGVGIAKSVNVGQTLTVSGNTTMSSNVVMDGPSMRIPVGNTAARPTGVLGQIRYNTETSVFEGFGAGNSWSPLGGSGIADLDKNTKITVEDSPGANNNEIKFFNDGDETMRLTSTGLLGLGTTNPSKQLEINSATGDALRLTYNDTDGSAVDYVDFGVTIDGNLTMTTSGGEVQIDSSNSFDVTGHNGSTIGLKLAGVLVTSTATELNYVDTTVGTAEASKALVLDADRNITNINSLNSSLLIASSATESTSVSTGAIVTAGGVGIAKNLNVGGISKIVNVTNSTNATNGALVVSGGAGITKALYVGTAGSSTTTTTGNVPIGQNWTNRTPSNTDITDTIWFGIDWSSDLEIFVAVGATFGLNGIMYSTDGVNWTVVNIPDATSNYEFHDVKWAPELSKFIAIGRDSDTFNEKLIVYTSADGISWTGVSTPTTVDGSTSTYYRNIDILRLVYSPSLQRLLAVSKNLIITSSNGTTWTEQRLTSKPYTAGTWAASINKFMLVGENSVYATSSDGLTWTHNVDSSGDLFEEVAWSPTLNTFIVKGMNDVYTSVEGTSLNAIDYNTESGIVPLRSVTVKNLQWVSDLAQFVAVSYANSKSLLTSSDGINWTAYTGISNVEYYDFAYSSSLNRLVAISSYHATIKIVSSDYSAGTSTTVTNPADGFFGLLGKADITGDMDVSGIVTIENTTNSTTITNGAVKVAGGVGIAKSVNIGETLTVTGDSTFNADLTVDGPSLRIPVGDTASRPTGTLGQVRYNTETSQFEGYGAGNAWGSLGGLIDVDQDTKITAEDSAGADNDELKFYNAGSESMRLTSTGLLGLGTSVPAKKLEINSATGDVLRLTYNDSDGSASNYADMNISSDGKLTINSSGNETIIHSSDSFNVAGHDGTTLGLKLGGTLVTATADELNYNDTTVGTVEASKAIILDANKDTTGIHALTATTLNATTVNTVNMKTTGNVGVNTSDLTFGLQVNETSGNVLRLTFNDSSSSSPASKADFTMDNANNLGINASSSVNIVTHDGSTTGLKLAGVLITSTAAELNYVDTTQGAAEASKALVLDSSKNITGINSISMNNLNLTFDNATGNTAGNPLTITRTTSATPANGLGVGMSFKIENSDNTNIEYGNVVVESTDITAASEDAAYVVNLLTAGAMVESMRLTSSTMYVNELYETSDRRVKENFVSADLQETHDRVLRLRLFDYNYIGNEKTHRGLIAQEVEEVIPVAVETENRNGIEDFKSVSNREITNHLVGSVQFLSQKLEQALAKIDALQAEINELKNN